MVTLNVLISEDSELHEVAIDFTVHLVKSKVPIVIADDVSEIVCIFIFVYLFC